MALAILKFETFERGQALFRIDIGTNKFYQIKIGKSVSDRNGLNWVDEVSWSTPLKKRSRDEELLNTEEEIIIPADKFDHDHCYAQLFSFKNQEGKSPAFSRVLRLPAALKNMSMEPMAMSMSNMQTENKMDTAIFNPARKIAHCDASQSFSIEDLLSSIARMAAPAIISAISGAGGNGNTQPASGSGASGPAAGSQPAGLLNTILNALLHGINGAGLTGMSTSQSRFMKPASDNRFLANGKNNYSQPFIFGIDDAILLPLISSVAGPLLQALPQLVAAGNQKALQTKAINAKLMTDLMGGVNQRLMLMQVLQHQQPGGGQPADPDAAQLLQLLQQLPSPPPAAGSSATVPAATVVTPPAAVAGTQSLSFNRKPVYALSTKALLSFETEKPIAWNGSDKILFNKNGDVKLRIKLNVQEPAPKSPLPKAIFKFCFKDAGASKIIFDKTVKQKDVSANTVIEFLFTKEELRAVPAHKSITLFAEMRWLLASGNKECKALGSTEVVFVNGYFLKAQGLAVTLDQELKDMKTYRTFWNKVWEAPVLDAARRNSDTRKSHWEVDMNVKYSMLLSAEHDSNGMMESKILQGGKDEESRIDRASGRMKAGIELSLAELNKLCTLWDNQSSLTAEQLDALKNDSFAVSNASEFIYHLKLDGRAGERGMFWIAPVLKMFDITLGKIQSTNDAGQVTVAADEKVSFPLPVAARVIGLKSE